VEDKPGATPVNIALDRSPRDIAVDPNLNKIFVSATKSAPGESQFKNGSLLVIDGNTKAIVAVVEGYGGDTLTVDPNTKNIFLADRRGMIKRSEPTLENWNEWVTSFAYYATVIKDRPGHIVVNPITNVLYMVQDLGSTIKIVDTYTNKLLETINVPGVGDIEVNPITNLIYLASWTRNSVVIMDGSTNQLIKEIKIGTLPSALTVNPNTNMIYVISNAMNSVLVIDGKTNTPVYGVTFEIKPLNSGQIYCNNQKVSNNYIRYPTRDQVKCEVIANPGFKFSSWSGSMLDNLRTNAQTESTTYDYLVGWLENMFSTSNSDSKIIFTVSKYGTLSANFIIPVQVSVPQEYIIALYGVVFELCDILFCALD
jgi:YVTN family beta-propeller protein